MKPVLTCCIFISEFTVCCSAVDVDVDHLDFSVSTVPVSLLLSSTNQHHLCCPCFLQRLLESKCQKQEEMFGRFSTTGPVA